METVYFTFGCGQENAGMVQPIVARNIFDARSLMFDLHGTKWSFMYDASQWQECKEKAKERGYPIERELPLVTVKYPTPIEKALGTSVRSRLEATYDRMGAGRGWNPQWFVVCVQLPDGAKELITNHSDLVGKVEYYLDKYDEDMSLKSCKEVKLLDFMIV